jgi:Na+/H+ antiporter NhaD/arsenite permease-like protein
MTSLTITIVVVFVLGYLCIALESVTKVNKAAVALLMCVICWVLYMFNPADYVLSAYPQFAGHADKIVLRKLIQHRHNRYIYDSMVIIAANSGGAFSPIGDVTTIMLWIGNMISTGGILREMFIPSVVSVVIPALILQFALKGNIEQAAVSTDYEVLDLKESQRRVVFFIGVGGLIFVPIFRFLTNLPPFMGILLVLGLLWTVTEIFYRRVSNVDDSVLKRVSRLLSKIDMSTILFFLGILMAVSCLSEVGVLTAVGKSLNDVSGGNHFIVTGVIGILSSIVDNVPLVAGCMGMYPISPTGDMATDGIFWQLLAYCAGVGGSILIIGSAAGVVVMGLEKISFGWYMRHISWIVLLGYLSGMVSYWAIRTFIY